MSTKPSSSNNAALCVLAEMLEIVRRSSGGVSADDRARILYGAGLLAKIVKDSLAADLHDCCTHNEKWIKDVQEDPRND